MGRAPPANSPGPQTPTRAGRIRASTTSAGVPTRVSNVEEQTSLLSLADSAGRSPRGTRSPSSNRRTWNVSGAAPPNGDRGAGRSGQLAAAGDEVGLNVGEHDQADADLVLVGQVQVLGDVTARVDDRCSPRLGVADQVGGLREAPQVEMLQDHDSSLRFRLYGHLQCTPTVHRLERGCP